MYTELEVLSPEEVSIINGGFADGLGDWITNTIDNIHKYGVSLGHQIGEAIWG